MLFAHITWIGLHASFCPLLSFDCFSQQTLILVGVADLLLSGDGTLSMNFSGTELSFRNSLEPSSSGWRGL